MLKLIPKHIDKKIRLKQAQEKQLSRVNNGIKVTFSDESEKRIIQFRLLIFYEAKIYSNKRKMFSVLSIIILFTAK